MSRSASLAAAFVLVPSLAVAHPGHESAGFLPGMLHPLSGMDHVLAMAAVGVFAAQLGGRALWQVPLSFVVLMGFGAILGILGIPVPLIELGIAASVITLGALIAFKASVPLTLASGLVGFFALFHGYAHGAEMPSTVSAASYGAGFVAATLGLHALGLALGAAVSKAAARLAGLGLMMAGAGLLASAM